MRRAPEHALFGGAAVLLIGVVVLFFNREESQPQRVSSPAQYKSPTDATATLIKSQAPPSAPRLGEMPRELLIADAPDKIGLDGFSIRSRKEENGAEFMKERLRDTSLTESERRHAAEVLVRIGTQDSVDAVVKEVIREFVSGRREMSSALLAALDAPLSLESCKVLVSVLLGHDESRNASDPPPEEIQSVIRKSLRRETNLPEIGAYLAELYNDSLARGSSDTAEELLNGVAHPSMLAELFAQAQNEGRLEDASNLSDRLIAVNDTSAVGAMVRLASSQPQMLTEASEVLFNWSLRHPKQAQAGIFAEYLNNQAAPREQRIAAAFGLAGAVGKAEARHALEKSISLEPNQSTRGSLIDALATLNTGGEPSPSSTLLPK